MTNLARGLDHVIIAVPDLGRAASACERMGFVVTGRASHLRFGTANRLLVFGNAYIELLAIVDPEPADPSFQKVLKSRGFGLHTFALATDDIDAEYRRLSAHDSSVLPPTAWTRTATDAEPDKIAAFSTMVLPESLSPVAPMFYCQQKTREMVWRARSLAHANGARRISHVVASVATVSGSAAGRYRSLFADADVSDRDGALRIQFSDHSLELQERVDFQEHLKRQGYGMQASKVSAVVVLEGRRAGVSDQNTDEARCLELSDSSAVMLVLK